MNCAFAIQENSIDSQLSDVLGRSKYFLIIDTNTGAKQIITNPFAFSFGGAGIQASQLLIENDCDVLITKTIGAQVLSFLESAGIKVYLYPGMKSEKALELFHDGLLNKASLRISRENGRRNRFRRRGSK